MVPAQSRSSLGSNASTAPDLDLSDEEVDEDDDKDSDSSCLVLIGHARLLWQPLGWVWWFGLAVIGLTTKVHRP